MVTSVERTDDGESLRWTGGTDRTLDSVKLRLAVEDRTNTAKIAAEMALVLQDEHDHRVLRSSLPADEPTKTVNPNQENFFWDGDFIVARSDIITVSFVKGTYQPSVRRAGGGRG